MLILASASKVRQKLLQNLGVEFSVIPSNINEEEFSGEGPKNLVQLLSKEKAEAVARKILLDSLYSNLQSNVLFILGCDSLFEFNGEVFGKPKSIVEAAKRLKMISSKSGFLHTGHCLLYRKNPNNTRNNIVFDGILHDVISTKINFCKISDSQIEKYSKTSEALTSAGGFNIEGAGCVYIKSLEGCYTNVMGISIPWLTKSLDKIPSNFKPKEDKFP